MIRRLLPILLMGMVIVVSLVDAQEKPADPDNPPLRLKKKKRSGDGAVKPPVKEEKDPDPAKEKPGKKKKEKEEEPLMEEDGPDADPQEDDKEILERIERNMRAVEEKLGNRELGDPTSQQQRDIVKDIESLIKRKQQSQGGGGAEQPQQGGGGGEQDKEKQKGGGKSQAQQKSGGGTGPRSMARNKQKQQKMRGRRQGRQSGTGMAKMQPGSEKKPQEKPGGTDKTGTGVGKTKENDKNVVADLYKKDVWGHLPESLRAQMNAYSNPSPFMPRYDDLIKKYYRTIAEQGRKKGD